MRHRHQNGISPPPLRTGLYFLHQLTTTGVKGLNRAQGEALGAADSHGVARIEFGTRELRDHEELESDRAAADDQHSFISGNAGCLDCVIIALMGARKVAASKLTLAGRRTMPRSATHGVALTYSPKPPPFGVKPAVSPVVLYCLHWEKRRRSQ